MEQYTHRVQYYETDQMGIVHHSNYIRWFEEARTDCLEKMGIPYDKMEEDGIISPVIAVEAEYLRMVRFGTTVTIFTKIKSYNGIKLALGYEVVDTHTGMVHCLGTSRHCFLNEKGRPVALKKANPAYHAIFMEALEKEKEEEEK